jgi:type II secretory pathway pseudopilin PulG
MKRERGFALLETVAVVGIVAIGAAALVLAISGAAKFSAHASGPNRTAALEYARQMLRVAQDAWKYGSPGSAPNGSADVTVPVAGPDAIATTMPARVTATVVPDSETGASISIAVSYTPDPGRNDSGSVTLSGRLRAIAPLPGTQVVQPGYVAQPDT